MLLITGITVSAFSLGSRLVVRSLSVYTGIYSSLSVCINRLKLAHNAYKEAKKDATKWCKGFQEMFVTTKAKERGLSEEVVIKQMKREKESKEKGLNSRIIRGRNNKATTKHLLFEPLLQNPTV